MLDNVKKIHIIGIGGVSMSKLAVYYAKCGYTVSGSDRQDSPVIGSLRSRGINAYVGSRSDIAKEADVVVYSSAIAMDDAEMLANDRRIERKELLKDFSSRFNDVITISGAHGKTTASAIISHVLYFAGYSITSHIGGDTIGRDSLDVAEKSKTLVIEGCEYKKSFLNISSDYSVVLNVDYDHPDTYRNLEDVYSAFCEFLHIARNTKFIDIGYYDKLSELYKGTYRCEMDNVVTFGESIAADYSYCNVENHKGNVTFDVYKKGEFFRSLNIRSLNKIIVKSAIAAIAVADRLGVGIKDIAGALNTFAGVSRRAECLGKTLNGARVITDYAHHPSEIKELLMNMRDVVSGRIIAVFEPHTYSRTAALSDEFVSALSLADVRIILPTYPAREKPDDGMDSMKLLYKFRESGAMASYSEYKNLRTYLEQYGDNDTIALIGAGIQYMRIYDNLV